MDTKTIVTNEYPEYRIFIHQYVHRQWVHTCRYTNVQLQGFLSSKQRPVIAGTYNLPFLNFVHHMTLSNLALRGLRALDLI